MLQENEIRELETRRDQLQKEWKEKGEKASSEMKEWLTGFFPGKTLAVSYDGCGTSINIGNSRHSDIITIYNKEDFSTGSTSLEITTSTLRVSEEDKSEYVFIILASALCSAVVFDAIKMRLDHDLKERKEQSEKIFEVQSILDADKREKEEQKVREIKSSLKKGDIFSERNGSNTYYYIIASVTAKNVMVRELQRYWWGDHENTWNWSPKSSRHDLDSIANWIGRGVWKKDEVPSDREIVNNY